MQKHPRQFIVKFSFLEIFLNKNHFQIWKYFLNINQASYCKTAQELKHFFLIWKALGLFS